MSDEIFEGEIVDEDVSEGRPLRPFGQAPKSDAEGKTSVGLTGLAILVLGLTWYFFWRRPGLPSEYQIKSTLPAPPSPESVKGSTSGLSGIPGLSFGRGGLG